MNNVIIPIEFELAAIKIAQAHFPWLRFKVSPIQEKGRVYNRSSDAIYFEAYFQNSLIDYDPLHKNNYYPSFNFYLLPGKRLIQLSGWWRNQVLTFIYAPLDPEPYNKHWQNDKNLAVPCPYPDGDKFEQMAIALFSLVQEYLVGYEG
ncbi:MULTISPECIES: hypothetical protein [Nostoc]|uniref:Uncharacterized protein n=1 Tax=Nostoc favosum CHAB5714 TaxID=2780399 RepID=A0ABS8ILD9_9NOSO|nr:MULTISPECIES: hypothetical protein [Nostoc]AVH63921.1 hypothetical protein NPM_2191 [Nostoc sp. 'Peltigera membranacea cyanobiont' N6]AVH68360.1 hypothetical protein NPM_20074 [Nostoc sp. 'Peltigera membranacea cyanobiont' N6]MBG1270541.1 hypothetical protein [Nostoc sp. WHI]MCC5604684.1 hypothetical protein [Nostoc favosum CHAB5714]MEA5606257.1 hypothetical protein [Nostoc sp. UHCC 0252]